MMRGRNWRESIRGAVTGNVRRYAIGQYRRWREYSDLMGALREALSEQRRSVQQLDAGSYKVGLGNQSTRDAWVEKGSFGVAEGRPPARCWRRGMPIQKILRPPSICFAGPCGVYRSGELSRSAAAELGHFRGRYRLRYHRDFRARRLVRCHPVHRGSGALARAGAGTARIVAASEDRGHSDHHCPFCSLTHFAPYHYATGFNRYFYAHHLGALGFDIIDMVENGNFFEYIAQEVRRIDDMAARYCCEKPSRLERHAIQVVLGMLERFSHSDRGSQEMLHFDYQVRAVKVRLP